MVSDPYSDLTVIMRKFGARGEPRDFYWAVNDAFHNYEASRYDSLHISMYEEEEPVWEKLLAHLPEEPRKLRFVDIGCGTGLVEHFLAKFAADRVEEIVLVDPNQAMLDIVAEKSKRWPFASRLVRGDISAVPASVRPDVITVNSVLHHIVELDQFCVAAQSMLQRGGLLLTAQDARADMDNDAEFCVRRNAARARRRRSPQPLRRILGGLHRRIRGRTLSPMEAQTSEPLLVKGVVQRPMDECSIYAVTDFHIPNQPGEFGKGISLDRLQSAMPQMRRLELLTFMFHGVVFNELSDHERDLERRWLQARDDHGFLFASAWQRR